MFKKIIPMITLLLGISMVGSGYAMTTYTIRSGDNVWKIAKLFRPQGISLAQMISAIHQLNPNAFSGPNQTMQVGVVLQVPTLPSDFVDSNSDTAATSVPSTPAPTVTEAVTSPSPAPATPPSNDEGQESSSGWAWLWFILWISTTGLYLYQRQWLPVFKRSHHQAADRAGTNRAAHAPHEISRHKTLGLAQSPISGEGTMTADVMIDIAEQRYENAEKKLLSAIRENKRNLDLRIKLLELYVMMNNQSAFNRHAEYMLKNLVSENDELWSRVREMYLKKWVYDN